MSLLVPLPPGPALCPPASCPLGGAGGPEQPRGAAAPGGCAQGALAGPGVLSESEWVTEPGAFPPLPMEPAPLPDLEAMAALLARELEQLEDFFLAEPLAPAHAAPFPCPAEALEPLGALGCFPEPSGLPEPPPAALASPGERRQKKRDQNKTAALRYRQRKRAEYEALGDRCQSLEARNRELREKAESIEREIQYVKDLLIEVYKARSERPRVA